MSQTRNGFSLFNSLPRPVTVSASILLTTTTLLLDFMCNQKMKSDTIDWDYYLNTPSRIVAFVLISLLTGFNLQSVIASISKDVNDPSVHHLDKLPAKKVMVASVGYNVTQHFTRLALTTPMTSQNAGYIVGSALLSGPLFGTMLTGAVYFLQRHNYTLRPITLEHGQYISMGMLVAMANELVNYSCNQMIKNNQLEWDSLTSPPRLLVLNLIDTLTVGVLMGVATVSLKKYSIDVEESVIQDRNRLITTLCVISPIASFVQPALMEPINETNAPYIVSKSIVQGLVSGFSSAASLFVLFRLIKNRSAEQAALPALHVQENTQSIEINERTRLTDPLLTRSETEAVDIDTDVYKSSVAFQK